MIKLNTKNKHIKAFCKKLMKSEHCSMKFIKITNEIVYNYPGYKIVTDTKGNILALWQLDNCPDPIFEV